jgi:hypothetical protein
MQRRVLLWSEKNFRRTIHDGTDDLMHSAILDGVCGARESRAYGRGEVLLDGLEGSAVEGRSGRSNRAGEPAAIASC